MYLIVLIGYSPVCFCWITGELNRTFSSTVPNLSSKISDDFNPSHISFIYNADIFASIWFFILSVQVPVSVHVFSSLFVSIYRFVLSIYSFVLSIYRFVLFIDLCDCPTPQSPWSSSVSSVSHVWPNRTLSRSVPNDFQVTLSSRCGLIDF